MEKRLQPQIETRVPLRDRLKRPFPTERERLLTDADFPEIMLSAEQRESLGNVSLHHVILDHNKPDLAIEQAAATTTWKPEISRLNLHYATNGGTSIGTEISELPITTIERPALPNHIGVPDLIATATQEILATISEDDLSTTWLSFASADVLMLHPQGWHDHFSNALLNNASLVTSYCGGLGLKGMLRLPEYYLSDPITIKNNFFAPGLMTEFFAIRADLARDSIQFWNDERHHFSYARFHHDKRVAPYVAAGRGVVESHFRWMISKALGSDFDSAISLMHPPVRGIKRPHRVYPMGVGYTSTHDESVRVANIAMAGTYNPVVGRAIEAVNQQIN